MKPVRWFGLLDISAQHSEIPFLGGTVKPAPEKVRGYVRRDGKLRERLNNPQRETLSESSSTRHGL